jgi:hypothetical protein
MGFNYHLGSHSSIFEFGALIRNAHKGQYAFSPTYDQFAANAMVPLMSQFTTSFTNPTFYGGSYKMGPITSFETTQNWCVMSGARINTNFCYTTSENYNVPDRTDTPPLVGQAPFSYNITPTYVMKRATVSLGISYDGPNIGAYQWQNEGLNPVQGPVNGPHSDNYYFERTQVDAQASYYIGKGFTITASEENVNNTILGFYNGSKQFMTQRAYYKSIYYGGIRWNLGCER